MKVKSYIILSLIDVHYATGDYSIMNLAETIFPFDLSSIK